MIKKLAMLAICGWLIGCTSVEAPRIGPEITVSPARYQLRLTVSNAKKAQQRLAEFTGKYAVELKDKTLHVTWFTPEGKAFATRFTNNRSYSLLVKEGVDDDARFDVLVAFEYANVVVQPCKPDRIGRYGNQIGCSVEHGRWQSMVNPENVF